MAELRTVPIENTAQAYLELLEALGLKYFIGNAGTDFASLIDAFARRDLDRKAAPRPIQVTHECCAVTMAHGYYLATGQAPLVMVHTTPGTANAAGALMNAYRARIPLVLTAGRTPITEAGHQGSRNRMIHWGQESFDQAGLVREFVKWDYELRTFDQLEAVVRRAFAIATSEPKGPVYLSLPREVLAEPHREFTYSTAPCGTPLASPYPDPRAIERLASMIAEASRPLILTRALGRNPAAVAALVALADSFAIPVVEYPTVAYMNFPASHPLHLGYEPGELLASADLVLAIDCEVPWMPHLEHPGAGARAAYIGIDPINSRYPVWSFPVDIAIEADSAKALPLLADALAPYRKRLRESIVERGRRLQAEHSRSLENQYAEAEKWGRSDTLTFEWISHCFYRIKQPDMVFVNEYDLNLRHLGMDSPGSFFGHSPAGYLGWGMGAALGIKLGSPDKTVICAIGDGSYIFGGPAACHLVSAAHDLPVLFIVTDNGGWNAVNRAARSVHPEGWAVRTGNFPLVKFGVSPKYETIVQAFGGHGEVVSSPREFPQALERSLKIVREERRQAVI
ncbi:MAG: thiamine pyrophosphate-requiring protein, partial [Candidatus Binataceae bacterium]